ncbi:glycosyl transferase [Planomonospora sphaerica]|uniref:4,4'-diaponeurosporenoate glycosyltransferase n=1 Tax=Planomonospora sphaerica TaxID=161355 RepID=A0A171DIQ6_9ACTN|nr:glycosyltransferase [Planomonospora sphaerica]GAT68770.1 glycosyl transferase [Planomonospora sphaerica]
MRLTIVLPCADDDGLDACLASIDEDVEVLAVLNGPTPAMRERVRQHGLRTIEIPERNLGAACQAGCVAASNEHILLMNTDSTFAPGAIRTLMDDWAEDLVVRATLQFAGSGRGIRLIENLQNHQMSNPDRAYQPGILFHAGILDRIGGYYFDQDVHWTEDADFDRRVRGAGIGVRVSVGVVRHGEVSVLRKLRSAFRYGIGRSIAESKRLYGTYPPFRPSLKALAGDWSALARSYGRATAAYGVVWMTAFAAGVLAQRHFEVYPVRDRLSMDGRSDV